MRALLIAALVLSAGPQRLDLKTQGLPLSVEVPACAKPSAPLVRIADNAKDVILACDLSDKDAMDGKEAFRIQLGLASGKVGKAEIKESLTFSRFIREDPARLEWEEDVFGQPKKNFLLRVRIAGVEYACFNQMPAGDAKLYAEMLASCASLKAK